MRLHLAGGQTYLEGWTNVDWTDRYKVDVKANILRPEFWSTLPDDSVEQVKCEHFIEHIGHFLPGTEDALGRTKDGLIWFMEQLYRVCRHGAALEFAFPHHMHSAAYGDPTHCRFVQALTFRYFDRVQTANGPMPDYCIPVDFEITEAQMAAGFPDQATADREGKDAEVFKKRCEREWNMIYEERVFLTTHKPMRRPL